MLKPMSVYCSYQWYKNGRPLENQPNVIYPAEGSVTINPLTVLDEGYYQCFASNMYGTAVSSPTVLLRADIGSYHSSEPVVLTEQQGRPYMIRCQPVKCFPKPSFTWALAERGRPEESTVRVITGKRIQVDEQGMFSEKYCGLWLSISK